MPHGLLNHYHCRVAPLGCPCGQAEGLCHLVSRRVVNSASQIGARLCSGLRQQATDLSCWSAQRGRWSVAPWPASRGREAVRARPKFLAAASALPLRRHWLAANPERAWNDQRSADEEGNRGALRTSSGPSEGARFFGGECWRFGGSSFCTFPERIQTSEMSPAGAKKEAEHGTHHLCMSLPWPDTRCPLCMLLERFGIHLRLAVQRPHQLLNDVGRGAHPLCPNFNALHFFR